MIVCMKCILLYVPDALLRKKKFGRASTFETHTTFFRRLFKPSPLGPFHLEQVSPKLENPEVAIMDGSMRLAALVLSDDSDVTAQSLCSDVSDVKMSTDTVVKSSVSTSCAPVELEREESGEKHIKKKTKAICWDDKETFLKRKSCVNAATNTMDVCDAETMTPLDATWCVVPPKSTLNFA